ncbi:UDP-4-amino-4,6-dideoxy-N-acetyl-beta-L-altrosamine transaminase [Marinospirillum perlucidum]|uniref:UDP-4-amino-4, 6-dideoxy-N-acetyl-beta-L-altrosamine transaminase n=1 Tax=Marinospirillum perlucidum TaxID=1982602 RepID=UPI000DF483DA|nr:UDP-4-amino-4,6-dideoxy-N-acetyl-beta-L-altrosamine transaminase [Marinospirillum perlucidum]
MIPYGKQDIRPADLDAVLGVLKSDFLTQGPQVPLFEQRVASICKVPHAVAVNSATSALHLACLALDLKAGDWLWTSPITFVASANCGLYCGAKVDFVDIDPKSYNLCPKKLEEKLIQAERKGTLPKIVVAVHLAGQPCDMQKIHALSERYGFKIIEDASHAIGATYLGQPVGNCQYSNITVFSFHPVKIITTAEGGLATTRNTALAKKMQLLRSHGITRESEQMSHPPDGPWYYQQIALGFNYRMTELQAALGVSQLDRLNHYITKRRQLAETYNQRLEDFPVKLPFPSKESAWHLYIIRLETERHHISHRQVFENLRAANIGVNLHYIPVHTQPWYQQLGFKYGDFPEAEHYYQQAISLPLHPGLQEDEVEQVIQVLEESLSAV